LIGVYNSAGELVKTIASEPASNLFTTVNFSVGTNLSPSSMLPGQLLDIYIPNLITPSNMGAAGTLFTWDGTTNGQQPVSSGSYYIKLQQVDTYNHVSVLIKEFSFLQEQQFVELLVYNSAGEIVYDSKLADIIPVQKSGNNNIQVIYGPALTDYISWNGKNNDGKAVGSGTYEIKILSQTLEGTAVTASKTIVVLSEGSKYLDNIKAYPNPYTGTGGLTFAWTSGETGIITIKIYNISGEIVRSLTGDLAAGALTWDCKTGSGYNVSQGYYVAVLSATDSEGYENYKTVKFAITNKP
jgi:flagellar hook assembly protein FlgD